jgi:hypothetical protein
MQQHMHDHIPRRARRLLQQWMALVAIVALLGVALAACGEEDLTPTPGVGVPPEATPTAPATPDATPEPTQQRIEHPTGADELVMLIEETGGFVPPHTIVTELPLLAVYGDGRVITQGPQILIYPPPALPNLQVTQLTEEGLQRLLASARDAGLLDGDAEYTNSMVADAETTIFTVNAEGDSYRVSVYALSFDELPPDTPEQEREARGALREFRQQAVDVRALVGEDGLTGEDTTYEFDRLQVVSQPADEGAQPTDPGITPGEAEWPLDTPLAELGEPFRLQDSRCAVIEGDDLDTLLPALREANTLTRWTSAGDEYVLYLRPLLPHEEGCETGAQG